jgi:hypothetical protein
MLAQLRLPMTLLFSELSVNKGYHLRNGKQSGPQELKSEHCWRNGVELA